MKLEYSLETKDLIALAKFQQARRKPKINTNVFWYALLPILMCAMALATGVNFGVMALIFGAFVGLFILWQNWYAEKHMEDIYSSENVEGLFGKRWMELTPDWLVVSTENAEGRYRWNCPKRLVYTTDHVFIVFNNLQAITIPRRTFLDETSFQTFKAALESHFDKNRKSNSANP